MSTTEIAPNIHTPGTPVTGTYCGIPISGTVVESHGHFYNHARYEITVAVDAESVQRVTEGDYLAAAKTGRVIVACCADGSAPQPDGWDSDSLAVGS